MHACESVKRINHACIRAEGNVVAHTFSQSNSASPQSILEKLRMDERVVCPPTRYPSSIEHPGTPHGWPTR
jgi:hypothetical protein